MNRPPINRFELELENLAIMILILILSVGVVALIKHSQAKKKSPYGAEMMLTGWVFGVKDKKIVTVERLYIAKDSIGNPLDKYIVKPEFYFTSFENDFKSAELECERWIESEYYPDTLPKRMELK